MKSNIATRCCQMCSFRYACGAPHLCLQHLYHVCRMRHAGGAQVLVTCREADGEISSSSPVCIMFDKEEVPATRLQRGVYRCHAPPHEAGTVSLSITWGNGSPCSNTQPFTYRVTPQTARTQVSPLTHGVLAPVVEISHQGFSTYSPHRRCGHCHVCQSDKIHMPDAACLCNR